MSETTKMHEVTVMTYGLGLEKIFAKDISTLTKLLRDSLNYFGATLRGRIFATDTVATILADSADGGNLFEKQFFITDTEDFPKLALALVRMGDTSGGRTRFKPTENLIIYIDLHEKPVPIKDRPRTIELNLNSEVGS